MSSLGKSMLGAALAKFAAQFEGFSEAALKDYVRKAEEIHLGLLTRSLHRKPVRRARAVYRDRSRYTGAMLRAIRAERGCGRPPKVLAARRAKREMAAELCAEADLRSAHTSHKKRA